MGTGINRMRELLAANNLPEPEFVYDTFFRVTIKRYDLVFTLIHAIYQLLDL